MICYQGELFRLGDAMTIGLSTPPTSTRHFNKRPPSHQIMDKLPSARINVPYPSRELSPLPRTSRPSQSFKEHFKVIASRPVSSSCERISIDGFISNLHHDARLRHPTLWKRTQPRAWTG